MREPRSLETACPREGATYVRRGSGQATEPILEIGLKGASVHGYFWWTEPQRGAVIARGRGGQNIYVVPEERLVMVVTAKPFSSLQGWVQNEEVDRLGDVLLAE